ncbi:MAG: ribosome small subunit-dependent GTPase A [Actinomycetota bacterium]
MPRPPLGPDALAALGWSTRWAERAAGRAPGTEPARVVRHDGVAVVVAGAHEVGVRPLRPGLAPLAVGDWVLVDDESIVTVLERTSLLQRRDPTRGGPQLIAANLDRVGIVCGLDRPVKPGRIQRFVVQVIDSGAVPVVVLTKADLLEPDDVASAAAGVARAAPAVDVIVTSTRTEDGLAVLRRVVADSTVAFVGESGAGKSTLVNALAGRELAATNEVRSGDSKGRHTTTSRELHVLPGHCVLVDTPGLREIGLFTDVETVDTAFDDVARDLDEACRFRDCTHTHEPDCAVLAAIARGDLDAERYAAWQALRAEAEEAEQRSDPAARREADPRFGRMAREAQRLEFGR